jgi:hypothetical protein
LLSLGKEGKEKKSCYFVHLCYAKGEKIEVLTHRPRYIETARVPKLSEGAASAAKPEYSTPAGAKGELAEVSKVTGQEKAESTEAPKILLKPRRKRSKNLNWSQYGCQKS